MAVTLPIVNAATATFECIFGRGCDGLCCKNGRPSVTVEERRVIDSNMHKFVPHLRPRAKQLIEKEGYISNRTKLGEPMLRVIDEFCVFFNEGCVFHKVGAVEGKAYMYKPVQCALFPLEHDSKKDEWFVRQWGVKDEQWDLFCLNPKQTERKAVDALAEEIELAASLDV